jgi:hypothetical protein
MITAISVRWLFTVVFVVAALGAAVPRGVRRGRVGIADAALRVPAVFCVAMCGSLVAMTWWSEAAGWAWAQAAAFGLAALWFGWAGLSGSGRGRLAAFLHALMAVAMAWMLTALPAGTAMAPSGSMATSGAMASSGAMAPMSVAATSAPVLAVSVLLAMCCAATAVWWLARAVGPRMRVKDSVVASHAAMSAGMAAMLFVML